MQPLVHFIGAGPGDPELITVKGQRLIREADLVVYAGSLVPPEIVSEARSDAKVIDSAPLNLEETHALLAETARRGGLCARVHTGDPSLFGAVREQMALLDRDGIPYAVVPGVTAAFAAAAAASASFTVPERCQSLVITRTPGRTPMPEGERLADLARHGSSLAVYLSAGAVEHIREELLAAGLEPETKVIAAHRVGWPGENVVDTTVDDLPDTVREHGMTRQTVFLILPGELAGETRSKLYDASFAHGFRDSLP